MDGHELMWCLLLALCEGTAGILAGWLAPSGAGCTVIVHGAASLFARFAGPWSSWLEEESSEARAFERPME